MGPALLAAIPALAGIAGSAVSAFGQHKANQQNLKIAREQMSFQERMSNTQIQRRQADLEAAGINPILAGFDPASSPGGASATMQNVGASAPGAAAEAVSSARANIVASKQLKLLTQQIANTKAQVAKTTAESHTAHSQSIQERFRERMLEGQRSFYFDPSGKPKGALLELARWGHERSEAASAQDIFGAEGAKLGLAEKRAMADLFSRVGEGGAGARLFMPLLLSLMRR